MDLNFKYTNAMTTETSRTLSPKSLNEINREIIQLLENSSFEDDITRLSVEMRAVELMNERNALKEQLEAIVNESIDWKVSQTKIQPSIDLGNKRQFIRKAQQDLAKWKAKLKRLQNRVQLHGMLVSKKSIKKLAMLRARKDYLHLKLNEVKSASGKQFKHLKSQFELRMKEYKNAYQDTLQELQ